MPLLAQTHPEPILRELRQLWRSVDGLQAEVRRLSRAESPSPNAISGRTNLLQGSVEAWTYLLDTGPITFTASPQKVTWLVGAIRGSYTHLALSVAIISRVLSGIVTEKWTLAGQTAVQPPFVNLGASPPAVNSASKQLYAWDGAGVGPLVVPAALGDAGAGYPNRAYYPHCPIEADSIDTLILEGTFTGGVSICMQAMLVGMYVRHRNSAGQTVDPRWIIGCQGP